MKRTPMKSGFEYDALTSVRHNLAYTQKARVKKNAKKQYQKRFRKLWKALINKEANSGE